MTLSEKWTRIDTFIGLFYSTNTYNNRDGFFPTASDAQKEANATRVLDAYYHGLFKPFNTRNGGFFEHAGLAVKYPVLHACKTITDVMTLNIIEAIYHAISLPLSFVYHSLGLITRTLATLISFFIQDDEVKLASQEQMNELMNVVARPHQEMVAINTLLQDRNISPEERQRFMDKKDELKEMLEFKEYGARTAMK